MKIVIIDDAFFTRKVYVKLLSAKYEVFEATNGDEGLQKCKDVLPDLVICDLLMPGMNGYQFLEAYSKWDVRAPVIICSSDVLEETREKCFELGADEFVRKPSLTDSEAFLKIVKNCIAVKDNV